MSISLSRQSSSFFVSVVLHKPTRYTCIVSCDSSASLRFTSSSHPRPKSPILIPVPVLRPFLPLALLKGTAVTCCPIRTLTSSNGISSSLTWFTRSSISGLHFLAGVSLCPCPDAWSREVLSSSLDVGLGGVLVLVWGEVCKSGTPRAHAILM